MRFVVVIDRGATLGVTAKVSAAFAVFVGEPESVTVTVALNVPPAVGVPEMDPLVGFSDSPPGSDPAVMLQVNGATPPAF